MFVGCFGIWCCLFGVLGFVGVGFSLMFVPVGYSIGLLHLLLGLLRLGCSARAVLIAGGLICWWFGLLFGWAICVSCGWLCVSAVVLLFVVVVFVYCWCVCGLLGCLCVIVVLPWCLVGSEFVVVCYLMFNCWWLGLLFGLLRLSLSGFEFALLWRFLFAYLVLDALRVGFGLCCGIHLCRGVVVL